MPVTPEEKLIPSHHPLPPRIHRRLRPVGQVEFAQDVADVTLDGFFAFPIIYYFFPSYARKNSSLEMPD